MTYSRASLPTIVDFPTIVQHALEIFGDLFANEPVRRHFAEYLTELMIAGRKTVSGINREFALTTDQSCLNRWLTETSWDAKAFHDRRLAWSQHNPKTRYSARGVIVMDNTLVDHAAERYIIAHDYIISNSVCPSGMHYPIAWRRFQKRDACGAGEFKDHTTLCLELIDDTLARGIPGDFTFDSYFTSAKGLNHLHRQRRAYVGDLKLNRNVVYEGREQKLNAVAQQIRWQDKKPVRVGTRRYWYFSKQMRIPEIDHPVRIVLF